MQKCEKNSSGRRKMITAGNFNPQNGINTARNGKHVVKQRYIYFFNLKVSLEDN